MNFAVNTHDLSKSFPKGNPLKGAFSARLSIPAVDQVNLQVMPGEIFGLVGPNGAGKTTLIKMLTTLIVPTSGSAEIFGTSLERELSIKKSVGLVTSDERSFYWRLTGQQNLEFFAALQGLSTNEAREMSAKAIDEVGLANHANKPFQKYSTGMKQRLAIARALLVEPKILFLDEPTKGLDPQATKQFHALIRNRFINQKGITVFLTSHNLAEIQRLCDRVAIMNQGKILACGDFEELQDTIDTKESYQIKVRSGTDALWTELLQDQKVHLMHSSSRDRTTLTYGPPAGPTDVNQILDVVRAAGGEIEQLSSQKPTLEDVFSEVTNSQGENKPRENMLPKSGFQFWPSRRGFLDDLWPGSMRHFGRTALAFLRRDILSEVSYRFSFFMQFINIFFSVGMYYFISVLIGDQVNPYLEPYGGDYFSFVLIGIAFSSFFGVGLSSFSSSLRTAQTTGTLEAMLSTPTRISTIILTSSQWNYLMTTVRIVVYLLVGILLLDVSLSGANFVAAIVILVMTLVTFSSLGIISAGFIMVLKRGDPVTWFFGSISNLFGGIYYPIAVMPVWMQFLAKFLPVTYALRAMRLALLQGATFNELRSDLIVLGAFCLILLPLSLIVFGYAVRLARVDGSLTHY